jgi:hypothetical protein
VSAFDRVWFLFELSVTLVPVATYFLILGVVSSRPHPSLLRARTDFLILTAVFAPVLLWRIPALMGEGVAGWSVLALVAVAGGYLFHRLLPGRCSGWTVYNVSAGRMRRTIEGALDSLGWSWRQVGSHYHADESVRISLSGFAFLRSATIHVSRADGPIDGHRFERLHHALGTELSQHAMLPSATGSCLLLLGVTVLIVPLWMMSRHMDAVVEVMQRLFFA